MRYFGMFALLTACAALTGGCMKSANSAAEEAKVYPSPGDTTWTDGPYLAGVAEGELRVPIGVSMGGYGFRPGPPTRFSQHLGGTHGRYHQLLIKTLVLTNNQHGVIVLTKTPLVFMTDLLRHNVIEKLKPRLNLDLTPVLIMGGTHTHSGPAGFWALPRGIGLFGMDEYKPDIMDAIASSIADTIYSAYTNLQPAKVAFDQISAFDPDDKITADRRGENDGLPRYRMQPPPPSVDLTPLTADGNPREIYKSKDRLVTLIRVDNAQDQPIALLFSVGNHGTRLVHEILSDDAPGAMEMGVQEAAHRLGWGAAIAMMFQGTAGDVTPTGDDLGHADVANLALLGKRFAEVTIPRFQQMKPAASGKIAVVSIRSNIDRKTMGYGDQEFGILDKLGTFTPYIHGGFQCGEFGGVKDGEEDADGNIVEAGQGTDPYGNAYDRRMRDGDLGCIDFVQLEGVLSPFEEIEAPIGELAQSIMTAVRIEDDLIVTLPGEPVSGLGDDLRHRVQPIFNARHVGVFGYSQHHHLYLTPEDDWFQGAYESAMSAWGWKFGGFLVDQAETLARQLADPGKIPSSRLLGDEAKYPRKSGLEPQLTANRSMTEPTPPGNAETTVRRLKTIHWRWHGGDPLIDPARMRIENQVDDQWQTFATDRQPGFLLRLNETPDYVESPTATTRDFLYSAVWEVPLDAPTGAYRLYIEGFWHNGTEKLPYAFAGGPVQIVEAEMTASVTAETITGTSATLCAKVGYPPLMPNYEIAAVSDTDDVLARWQDAGMRIRDMTTTPSEIAWLSDGRIAMQAVAQPGGEAIAKTLLPVSGGRFCSGLTYPAGTTSFTIEPGGLQAASGDRTTARIVVLPQ